MHGLVDGRVLQVPDEHAAQGRGPVVAALLGLIVLGEEIRVDGAEWLLVGALVVVMVVSTIALSRSSARSR